MKVQDVVKKYLRKYVNGLKHSDKKELKKLCKTEGLEYDKVIEELSDAAYYGS